MYGRKSNALLWPQDPNDKPAYLYRRAKRGQQYKMGLDVVYVSGGKIPLNNYFVLEYDRDIYKNLDYVSGTMTCGSFGKSNIGVFSVGASLACLFSTLWGVALVVVVYLRWDWMWSMFLAVKYR
jgi:hypothetical protein